LDAPIEIAKLAAKREVARLNAKPMEKEMS
jgi:hypothetical protein